MDLSKKLEGIPKIYWINLDRSKDRRAIMEKQFDDLGIKNHQRIEGIDGNNTDEILFSKRYLMESQIKKRSRRKYLHQQVKLHNGILGCFASHIKSFYTFITDPENKDNQCLIAEDDLSFESLYLWRDKSWKDFQFPTEFDTIKLCNSNMPKKILGSFLFFKKGPIKLLKMHLNTMKNGTCIYMVSRSFATKMVRMWIIQKKINFTGGAPAADVFLYRFNSYYFPIFTYRSSNVSTIAGSSSKNYELAKYLYLQYLGQFGIQ